MAMLRLGSGDGLYFEYDPPGAAGRTFVFVNALTGNTGMWQGVIGPELRRAGYGTLAYNFRGQADSPFSPDLALDAPLITGDLQRLLAETAPPAPILVGLSIGGLFAARAWLGGSAAEALVLINTLRKSGPKLAWLNAAMERAAATGGPDLLMDMYLPLLVNPEALPGMRAERLQPGPYTPLDPAHGHYKLLAAGDSADWDLPYEDLNLPVLIMTGLKDRVFYEAEDVEELTARLPDSRTVVFDNAGHLLPAERPSETAAALLQFANGL